MRYLALSSLRFLGEGAVDVAAIREAIKRVIEGGKVALKLRREKFASGYATPTF
jgi:hypothetical protein